ncbi:MAG: NAD(P)H-hydrate dehydratase [Pseudorhodoplanes sp.]|nr:NAD(P)H-hydrate dehydratase [Pseudorhodoplanes sp.]
MELLTNAEMAEADRLAVSLGVASRTLMDNAGRAVAEDVAERHAPPARVTVVAGTGNNGGDGFVAARLLAERGYRVDVLLVGDRERMKGDAAAAAGAWTGTTRKAEPGRPIEADIVVDALFGAGLDRPVEGLARSMIEAINSSGAAVVAVDLPSGVNGSTGQVMGAAVTATRTVTFFRRKPGHVLLPGRLHCGPVTVVDIGIPDEVLARIGPKTFLNLPDLWLPRFPVPQPAGHKYNRGHVVVVSGGLTSTGAARLSASGALRAGAGLVTIASPRDALAVNAASSLAVMVRPGDARGLAALLADKRVNAVVLGPGGGVGAPMRKKVLQLLASAQSAVLDADALTSFVDDPKTLFTALRKRAARPAILTPHGGEFDRIFRRIREKSQVKQKLEDALKASHETSACLVFKGADTVVAAPDGRAAIAENLPPTLATAGSGDVLSGIIAGLLAQGMPAFEAAAAAVWLHGEASNLFGPGLISEDLPAMLPQVLRTLSDHPAR